ncbi:MAG: methionine biosynthesis protein MetW [Planctomycetaceae bacterium]
MANNTRYKVPDSSVRMTDELIMDHIVRGSRVIDLGCGDGRLLQRLRDDMDCRVTGVDLERRNVVSVISRGLPVVAADLNEGLVDIPSDSFDFAVLSQTLQQVQRPRDLLVEMLRVARRALVVVPNFGHWRVRYEVLWRGRTPVTADLPYEWHESPNVHFMSMYDFRELMQNIGLRIVKESPIIRGHAVDRAWAANLRADSAFYLLERGNARPANAQTPASSAT